MTKQLFIGTQLFIVDLKKNHKQLEHSSQNLATPFLELWSIDLCSSF